MAITKKIADQEYVTEKLTGVVYSNEADGEEATVPVDAETLGGLPASEYATDNYVQDEIAAATNDLQAQINGKQDAITRDLTPGMVAICSQTDGKITTSSVVSTTELGYLDGVTSNIQDQFKDTYSLTATGTAIAENDDLDSYTTPGIYSCTLAVSATLANNPHPTAGFKLIVQRGYTANRFIQELYTGVANGAVWTRFYAGSEWGSWKRVITSLSDMGVTATATELNYVDGVTSNIQTQLNGKQDAITGLTSGMVMICNSSGKIATSSIITASELGYLDGVTSNIQTQLNGKQAAITGLTSGMVMICNSSGKIATSSVVSTAELGYLDGVTSAIQTQLNNRYDLNATGTTIATSADLNNYTTPGVYSAVLATAETLTNCPVSSGFKMVVEHGYTASSRVIQTIYSGTAEGIVYRRFKANSTWGTWKRQLSSVLDSSDYGTSLPSTATAGRIFFKKVT